MLKKLFSRTLFTPPAAPPPAVPPGERVYAIGDIHGCDGPLDRLLDAIAADDHARGPARTSVIVLGDVVDRGPGSAQVVERLLRLRAEWPAVRFLKGNHEEIMLLALAGDEKALRLFCRIGGRETALSYGMDAQEYESLNYQEFGTRLAEIVPAAHRLFLDGFEDVVTIGDYAFVHAGIRPGVALEEQLPADLRWIRAPFLDHRGRHERVIVHGHTIAAAVERRVGRIGIDTGAYAGGALTALGLEHEANWTIDVPTDPNAYP